MSDPPPPPPEGTAADAPVEASATAGQLLLLAQARNARSVRQRGRKLFRFGLLATALALGYFTYQASVADPLHLYLGQAIFLLGVFPALMWAKRAQYGLPLFEALMITSVNAYAIPLLSGHSSLRLYTPVTITTAAFGVVLYQITANLTYYLVPARPKRGRVWRTEIVSRDISRVLGYGMAVTTAYTVIVQFTDWIPSLLVGETRAICIGLGIIATFVQCRRWGQGDLPHHDKVIFVAQVVIQVLFNWVSLFLVQGVTILLLALLGYVSGSKRVPLLAIVVVFPVIAVLFNGKSTMRAKYWDAKVPLPAITDLPGFFSEWVTDGLTVQADADQAGVLDRTSLIQMMCLVASQSPDPKPYLMGETYAQIPGQLVPRYFWPNKPEGHQSTSTLAVYYGLQTAEETASTTIGFGTVTESYANFGLIGTILLGFWFGLFFKKVTGWGSESPIFSYPGLFMVVLMAWTFQTELPMSTWLASLSQACEAVLGLPFILKNFFK